MRAQSVKQSLFIYAGVVSLALCFTVATVSITQVLSSSRRAQTQTAKLELQTLVHGRTAKQVQSLLRNWQSERYAELAIITHKSKGQSLSIAQAKAQFESKKSQWNLVLIRLDTQPPAYLIARLPTKNLIQSTQKQIRRILIVSLFAAIFGGLLLGFLTSRLVLPPLSALQNLVSLAQFDADHLDAEQAPNEIAEVAQSFRRTVRKLSEEREQLEAKHKELQIIQAGMNRASKLASLGRVAAGIAHEIGNPLAAIKGYLSLIKRGLDEKEQEDVITRSISELDRIHETIRQLLTFARRDEANKTLECFDLAQKTNEVIQLAKNHPALRNIQIHFDSDSEPNALGHPEGFKQVIMNLVVNAGQAMTTTTNPKIKIETDVIPAKTGIQSVNDSQNMDSRLRGKDQTAALRQNPTALAQHHGAIWIKIKPDHSQLVLRITDNGPGIDTKTLEQIFDPFFTTKDPGEGTGLGLAVSRALMEDMGGKLNYESAEGRGACFAVVLRRKPT